MPQLHIAGRRRLITQALASLCLLTGAIVATAQDSSVPAKADNTADAPPVTIFPHPVDSRWWLSGQANIIFQGRPAFHSTYQGTNSFRNSSEYKASMVGTIFAAVRPTPLDPL